MRTKIQLKKRALSMPSSFSLLFFSLLIFFGSFSKARGPSCGLLFDFAPGLVQSSFFESQKSIVRENYNLRPRWDEKFWAIEDYLEEKSRIDIFDKVDTYFSTKFDTRFWFSNASPMRRSEDPLNFVDPQAKAIFIFIHGSGTAQSSGRNFAGIMNSLTKMGFSAISFDLPFHGDGPLQNRFLDADIFMGWLNNIVSQFKGHKKPIYLVGHSFGPDVIAEYLTRYPMDVAGGLLLSPAGFNKTLSKWYAQKTSRMKFGGEVPANEIGGQFAASMGAQFIWNKGKYSDPTRVNPSLKIHMLTGDREEYVPAPTGGRRKVPIGPNTYDVGRAMQKIFSGVEVVVEKNVGHYIFTHVDEAGQNAVMREILRIAGVSNLGPKELMAEYSKLSLSRNTFERISQQFYSDRNFQVWLLGKMSERQFLNIISNPQNENMVKNIGEQYEEERLDFENRILNILDQNRPELQDFLHSNRSLFQAYRKDKKTNASPFIRAFGIYLRSLPQEQKRVVLKLFE